MMDTIRTNLAERPAKILAQAQLVVVAVVALLVVIGLDEAVGLGVTTASAALFTLIEKLIARPAATERFIEVAEGIERTAMASVERR